MGTTSPHHRRTSRLAVAGLLGAAVLTGGSGAAYAASTDSRVVETGYAVVVDGGTAGATNDCPGDAVEGTDVSVLVEAGVAR